MAGRFADGFPASDSGVELRSTGVAGLLGEVAVPVGNGIEPDRGATSLASSLAREQVPAEGSAALAVAATGSGLSLAATIPLTELTTRAAETGNAVELSVPAPPEGQQQVILEADGTGVLRWHVPLRSAPGATGSDRGPASRQRFRIPVTRVAVADPDSDQTDRGAIGFGVRKVLHLLRYPVEQAAEIVGGRLVEWWEGRTARYGLSVLDPGGFGSVIDDRRPDAEDWRRLAEGPVLLFVHGTFSRVRSGFAALGDDPAWLADAHRRYQGRVLAFDHPTLSAGPAANAAWFAGCLPGGQRLTLDVLTHSRGGLVGRCLPEALAGHPDAAVRALVHAGSPNAGTVLASEQHLDDLLDTVTTLLSLLPAEEIAVPAAAVLEVVKQVATGVRKGLDGLASMDPDGTFLAAIDRPVPDGIRTHAVAADFTGSAKLSLRALDALADRLFGTGNDLVVPTDGVHTAGRYLVPDPLVLRRRDVGHLTLFRTQEVKDALAGWLTG